MKFKKKPVVIEAVKILRGNFFEVAEVRPDIKRRVTLKHADLRKMYRVYENALGQMILDPLVMVPASEMWLYENKEAIASVRKGLKESREGKIKSGVEFESEEKDVEVSK